MKGQRIITITASLLLLAGLAVGGEKARAGGPNDAAHQVRVENFSFSPATLTVPAGTTVTWENRDDTPHTIVSEDKAFKSKALDTDEKFSYTFAKPGTYSYFCSLHPRMTGTVVVR